MLSELANAGRPLFPGNDVDDQLKRIFRYPLWLVLVGVNVQSLGYSISIDVLGSWCIICFIK